MKDRCSCDGGNYDRRRSAGDLPQRRGAFLLKLRVWRQILKGQHVARGQRDHGIRIASAGEFTEAAQHRDEVFNGAVVADHENQGPLGGALKKREQQGFGGRCDSGHTNPPRALFQMGGRTREGWKFFHVREEFANEGKQHAFLILAGLGATV